MAATPLKLTLTIKLRSPSADRQETMRRYLPYFLVSAVFTAAVLMGIRLYREHQNGTGVSKQSPAAGRPGAEPPHVRGVAGAPVTLEEFGDFECMPCLLLWPALRNLENDYGDRLAVIFRQHPLAPHHHAGKAAQASEAARSPASVLGDARPSVSEAVDMDRGHRTRARHFGTSRQS
jgi:hypothetical protein